MRFKSLEIIIFADLSWNCVFLRPQNSRNPEQTLLTFSMEYFWLYTWEHWSNCLFSNFTLPNYIAHIMAFDSCSLDDSWSNQLNSLIFLSYSSGQHHPLGMLGARAARGVAAFPVGDHSCGWAWHPWAAPPAEKGRSTTIAPYQGQLWSAWQGGIRVSVH